jgi:hypothetical protein
LFLYGIRQFCFQRPCSSQRSLKRFAQSRDSPGRCETIPGYADFILPRKRIPM